MADQTQASSSSPTPLVDSHTKNNTSRFSSRGRREPSVRAKSPIQTKTKSTEPKPLGPHEELPVQPWSDVRSNIANLLISKNLITPVDLAGINLELQTSDSQKAQPLSLSSSAVTPSIVTSSPDSLYPEELLPHTARKDPPASIISNGVGKSLQNQHASMPAMSVTIPHGFLPLRTLTHSHPTIQSVLYISTSSMFVSLDSHHVNLWKGGVRIGKFSTQPINENNRLKASSALSSSTGNGHHPGIVAISKWIYLEKLRVFIVADTRLQMKILNIHFEELFKVSNPKPVLSIEYIPEKDEIICGEVGSIKEHDSQGSIPTCRDSCDIHKPGGGMVKVWNARKYLMFDFHDHFNEITGIILAEKGCEASPGSIPVLISSSLDATVRMWNFETGQSLYRIHTHLPCLGIAFIKKSHFYHYTKADVQLWNINRYQLTFSFFRSTPFLVRRVTHPRKPARILTAVSDGSIKMISPVSGNIIGTGFPIHKDTISKDIAWNMNSELTSHEKIECICGLDFYNHKLGINTESDTRIITKSKKIPDFFFISGTESGQIINLNLEQRGKQEFIIQAHAAQITMLSFDPQNVVLVSGAQDFIIKVWTITSVDSNPPFGGNIISSLKPQNESSQAIILAIRASISISGFEIPSKTIAISNIDPKMAVPFNGGIVISSYSSDKILTPGKIEQDSGGRVCAIASAYDFGIWASANDDGTVKIWDSENIIIREIQFGEAISCLCFANNRGDLLVGIADQISIVRVQDYMTYPMLRHIVDRDYVDDITEIPISFDPSLDFWEYRYEHELRENGKVEGWHVQKEEIQDIRKAEDELAYLLQLSHNRRNNVIEHTPVTTIDTSAKILNDASGEPYLVGRISVTSPTFGKIEIPEINAVVLDTGIPEESHIDKVSQQEKLQPSLQDQITVAEKEPISHITHLSAPSKQLEVIPTVPLSGKKSGRLRIREILLRANVALPNSTVIKEIEPVRRIWKMRLDALKAGMEGSLKDDSENGKITSKPNMGSSLATEYQRRMSAKSAIEVSRRSRPRSMLNSSSRFDDHHVSLEDDYGSGSINSLSGNEITGLDFICEEPLDDLEETITHTKKNAHGHKKPARKGGHSKNLKEKSKPEKVHNPEVATKSASEERIYKSEIVPVLVDTNEMPSAMELPSDAMPQPITSISIPASSNCDGNTELPQTLNEKDIGPLPTLGSYSVDTSLKPRRCTPYLEFLPLCPHVINIKHDISVPKMIPHSSERKVVNIQKNNQIRGVGKGGGTVASKVCNPPSEDHIAHIDSINHSVSPCLQSPVKLQTSFSVMKSVLEPIQKQSLVPAAAPNVHANPMFEEAAVFVWQMLRSHKKQVSTLDKQSPINSKNSDHTSDQTFSTDFRDPLNTFLLPQIDQLTHSNPDVRATMCDNISRFHLHKNIVIPCLIYSLNDSSPTVIDAALLGLAQFGISDEQSLCDTMIHFGMIKGNSSYTSSKFLEKHALKEKLDELELLRRTHSDVDVWLHSLHRTPNPIKRADSYFDHLAGKYFPPDANSSPTAIGEERPFNCMDMINRKDVVYKESNGVTFLTSNIDGWDVSSNYTPHTLSDTRKQPRHKAGPLYVESGSRCTLIDANSRHAHHIKPKSPRITTPRTDATRPSVKGDRLSSHRTSSRTVASMVMQSARVMTAGYAGGTRLMSRARRGATPQDLKLVRPNTTGGLFGNQVSQVYSSSRRPQTFSGLSPSRDAILRLYMPPKRIKSGSKRVGKGDKSQRNERGGQKKDKRSGTGDSTKELEFLASRRKDLRVSYLAFCKQYLTHPLPGVLKRIDSAIDKSEDIIHVIVSESCVRSNDIAAIRCTFRKYTPLASISFWRTRFQDSGLSTLVAAVMMKQTLVSLQLVGNYLNETHAPTLARLCSETNKLKTLVVDHNHFGKGCVYIIEALCNNPATVLQKLSMRYCAMDAGASPALGALISKQPTLCTLDIGGNSLRDHGLPPLSSALSGCKTLRSLGLAFNEISDTVVNSTLPFADLCKSIGSSSLILVDLGGNFFGDHGMDKIFDVQKLRRTRWAAGKGAPLKIVVPERANNKVFNEIMKLNVGVGDLRRF
ncbi:hypothetical protein BSLG_010203 [Batrachochytrium salamandrivorans]|nr:hypothetical protein BSLG_010203 [Batrachochytrium salamandrivorans]